MFILGVCADRFRFTNPHALHRKSALQFTSNPTPMGSCDDWDFRRRTTAARKLSMYDETYIRPVTREKSRLIVGVGDRLQPAGRGLKLKRCPQPGRSVSFRKSSTLVERQNLTISSVLALAIEPPDRSPRSFEVKGHLHHRPGHSCSHSPSQQNHWLRSSTGSSYASRRYRSYWRFGHCRRRNPRTIRFLPSQDCC